LKWLLAQKNLLKALHAIQLARQKGTHHDEQQISQLFDQRSNNNPRAQVKNIVLVHGALADASGWRAVYDILKQQGYRVSLAS
jgi:hypothetical protein